MPAKASNTKRGNNDGCIRKRSDGRWEGIYVACYKPDGTPVRRSIYGKSRPEVASQMRETLRQIEQDEYVPPVKLTVGEWMHEWLRVYCLSSKKLSTCTGYEITITQHICPYFHQSFQQPSRWRFSTSDRLGQRLGRCVCPDVSGHPASF